MSRAVTRFNRAILRRPPESARNGLRAVDRGVPDLAGLQDEHAGYQRALEDLGVTTLVLPAIEAYPDCLFVEDPAMVFSEGAIVLRPGAPTRLGEAGEIAPVLEERFAKVVRIESGFVEGGDVLVTPETVLIGRSSRTDGEGARQLAAALAKLGYDARIVRPPAGILHFKTACSMVAERIVLATRQLLDGADYFAGLDVIEVAAGEEPAANALGVNGTVLLPAGFPATAQRLRERGLFVRTLALDNTMLLDAGLSCMSLRWLAP